MFIISTSGGMAKAANPIALRGLTSFSKRGAIRFSSQIRPYAPMTASAAYTGKNHDMPSEAGNLAKSPVMMNSVLVVRAKPAGDL